MVKKVTRQKLLQHLKTLSPEAIHAKSVRGCENLCGTEEYRQAGAVMLFLSLPEEIQTRMVLENALGAGKTVLVPLIDWEHRMIVPVTMQAVDEPMVRDRMGLQYPAAGRPFPVGQIDLVVVPGLGFDTEGNRLGRGGGYYDRFLSHNGFGGVTCGFAFEEQFLANVPIAEHDVPLDMAVSGRKVRRFYRKD